MTNKEKYRIFCETEGRSIPLFQQYWWMETVCHGKLWDVSIAYDGDRIVGVMPYHYGRKYGMTFVIQPQLTQFSGPYYCYPEGLSESKRLEFEKDTANKLLVQMDDARPAIFLQNFSPAITNWLPFHWKGFSQTTRYTYRIDDISDPQRVFQNFDREKRQRKILRCERDTNVRFDMSPADFARFHQRYYTDKGVEDLLDIEFIERVCLTAITRGNGVIGSLYDKEGQLLAARFVAFDEHCAYSLLSALDIKHRHSGYSETLFWQLIQHLSGKVHSFDFEGSMDEGIEYFYRSFGATQIPFSAISHYKYSFLKRIVK